MAGQLTRTARNRPPFAVCRAAFLRPLDSIQYFDSCQNMEIKSAVAALGALAQETRLAVFRLLIEAGPGGLPAGLIAARLEVAPATLSFHLGQLERAGLLASRRNGRQILYAADIEGTRRLMAFLTEDCCGGHPELCGDLVRAQGC